MLRHLGYVAMCLSIESATNRTCRLRNATPERLRDLIASNLGELGRVLRFNADHEIGFYRASSHLIPFASHEVNTIPWWEEHAGLLSGFGALIRETGQRVTMHPGQFTVLNSPRADVVRASLAEIEWHVRLLDALGTGRSSKIVLHGGGTSGGKEAAMGRFEGIVAGMPEAWRSRIIIENDEHAFGIEDILELSARTGLPVVFDNLHDRIHSGRDDGPARFLPEAFATWTETDGPPKTHFSTQAPGGRPGQHADDIDPDEFARYLEVAPRYSRRAARTTTRVVPAPARTNADGCDTHTATAPTAARAAPRPIERPSRRAVAAIRGMSRPMAASPAYCLASPA